MKQRTSIFICYLELSGYFIACLETLVKKHDIDVHVVRKLINKEAPFKLNDLSNNIKLYNADDLDYNSLKNLAENINPDLFFSGGWGEKKYLKLAKHLKKTTITVLGFDNKWEGNLKQRILITLGRIIIKPKFNYAFVPGQKQKKFAQKLGFPNNKIKLGAYSADINYFSQVFDKNKANLNTNQTKHFLYIGRYIKHKGIFDMWNAFAEIQAETPNDWEFWCIGTGEEEPNKFIHPKIKHFGFVQPNEMVNYLKPNGVYILPSHFEPWGVSVHEMAASGYPMILSNEIGAREVFLNNNGLEIEAKSISSIKSAMKQIMELGADERTKLGRQSFNLSKLITPETWANQIIKMMKSN